MDRIRRAPFSTASERRRISALRGRSRKTTETERRRIRRRVGVGRVERMRVP